MQVKGLAAAGDEGDVGQGAAQQRGDVGGPVDVGVRGFGEVVLQEEVADPVVEGVVDAALALEGVAFGEGAGFKEELDKLIVAA